MSSSRRCVTRCWPRGGSARRCCPRGSPRSPCAASSPWPAPVRADIKSATPVGSSSPGARTATSRSAPPRRHHRPLVDRDRRVHRHRPQQRQERGHQPCDQARRPQRVRVQKRRQPAPTNTLRHHPPSPRAPPHRSTMKTHPSFHRIGSSEVGHELRRRSLLVRDLLRQPGRSAPRSAQALRLGPDLELWPPDGLVLDSRRSHCRGSDRLPGPTLTLAAAHLWVAR